MKVYLIKRFKADVEMSIFAADYSSVLDVLSHLDGTDERIEIHFFDVYKVSNSSK